MWTILGNDTSIRELHLIPEWLDQGDGREDGEEAQRARAAARAPRRTAGVVGAGAIGEGAGGAARIAVDLKSGGERTIAAGFELNGELLVDGWRKQQRKRWRRDQFEVGAAVFAAYTENIEIAISCVEDGECEGSGVAGVDRTEAQTVTM